MTTIIKTTRDEIASRVQKNYVRPYQVGNCGYQIGVP